MLSAELLFQWELRWTKDKVLFKRNLVSDEAKWWRYIISWL